MDRIGHPDWVKLCVELNCAPNQNTFCYNSNQEKKCIYEIKGEKSFDECPLVCVFYVILTPCIH